MSNPTADVLDGPVHVPPGAEQVQITGLNKSFGRKNAVHVLKDVNLVVEAGELLVLLGPSGCGKTTLLRCLVGLERPDEGQISLNGTVVLDSSDGTYTPPNRRDVGMVFQDYALWPHMTVRSNVGYPLKARGLTDSLKSGRVDEVLKVVQCGHLADRYPYELSGGQQQRVSLARALASTPSLLLLDEPLSNLDVLLRVELRAQLRLLHQQLRFTGVLVTHDQEEALALGTRVAVMNNGRVEQIGRPADVYRSPATEYVADFLGARNRFELVTRADGAATLEGRDLGRRSKTTEAGTYAVRARDTAVRLRPATDAAGDPGTVWVPGATILEILPGGERSEYVARLGDNQIFASIENGMSSLQPGDSADVGLSLDRMLCYGSTGTLTVGTELLTEARA